MRSSSVGASGTFRPVPLTRPIDRRRLTLRHASVHAQETTNGSTIGDSSEFSHRLLCPVSLVGALIGRKGENIRKLQSASSSDIVVDHHVKSSDERVIRISSVDGLIATVENLCGLQTNSLADGSDDPMFTEEEELSCDARLLLDTSQVGFVVGKSGASIKAIVEETGAHVRIMPRGELPPCACVSDELVQITGSVSGVSAACRKIGAMMEEHPPKRRGTQRPINLAQACRGHLQYLPKSSSYSRHDAFDYAGPSSVTMETIFRMLAPANMAGNIIGKGGCHISKIRQETGSRIKMYGSADDVEERLVCVFSSEDPNQRYCAAQDALVRCAISLAPEEGPSKTHTIRLLAPQVSVGALLGRKGVTVMQLRRETGTTIRVLAVEAPLAAAAAVAIGGGEPGGDEIIQIEGALHQCIAALRGVATLLRSWQIRRTITATPRAVTTITLSPGLLAESLAMGAAHGGLVAVPVTAHGAGSPAAYATVAHGTYPSSPPVLWRYPADQRPGRGRDRKERAPRDSNPAAYRNPRALSHRPQSVGWTSYPGDQRTGRVLPGGTHARQSVFGDRQVLAGNARAPEQCDGVHGGHRGRRGPARVQSGAMECRVRGEPRRLVVFLRDKCQCQMLPYLS